MAWRLQHIYHSAEKYAGTVEKTAGGQINWTGKINLSDNDLYKPLKLKKPAMIFVNSQSDLFHENIPFDFVDKVFAIMGRCQHHIFQVLTKRPDRMLEYYNSNPYHRILNYAYQLNLPKWLSLGSGIDKPNFNGNWGWKHVWLGVSVEDQEAADKRIPLLLQLPAAVRFLSCEPLLEPVRLDRLSRKVGEMTLYDNCLTGFNDHELSGSFGNKIDWVIVGGESGNNARPMNPHWVRAIRDQCLKNGVPFFFKQWGEWRVFDHSDGDNDRINGAFYFDEFRIGPIVEHRDKKPVRMAKVGKKLAGNIIDGGEWKQFPFQIKEVDVIDPDLFFTGADY